MKKVLLYLLLFVVTAETSELDQLAKLPILFQHFAEHQQRDSSVSLMQFLSMHYWGDDMNDNDNDRDMQLPFKKLDDHHSQIYFLPAVRVVAINDIEQPVNANTATYNPGHIPDRALASLFRPPKV
ncbi:MAG: hypothetical protein V4619_16010 [Bacteroidota bacterium]